MKNLFSNVNFRRNLFRWIFMYVGVMLLFTTIVTYSKYIAHFTNEASSRVAKFEVGVDYLEVEGCKPGEKETICQTGLYRPMSEIPYYFNVTTEFEVRFFFVLTIHVAEDFEIVGLYSKSLDDDDYQSVDFTRDDNNEIRLEKTTAPNEAKNTQYMLVVKYKGENLSFYNQEEGKIPYYRYEEKKAVSQKVVTVDYSAVQVKGESTK